MPFFEANTFFVGHSEQASSEDKSVRPMETCTTYRQENFSYQRLRRHSLRALLLYAIAKDAHEMW